MTQPPATFGFWHKLGLATGTRDDARPVDFATLEHRLRELAFLNSGVYIVLSDMRHAVEKREEMRYEGGVTEFVKYLDRNKKPIVPTPVVIGAELNGIAVEAALWWNDTYHENVLCFTNNIPQRDGGTHLAGFRAALTRQITGYADNNAKKEKVALTGDDCREDRCSVCPFHPFSHGQGSGNDAFSRMGHGMPVGVIQLPDVSHGAVDGRDRPFPPLRWRPHPGRPACARGAPKPLRPLKCGRARVLGPVRPRAPSGSRRGAARAPARPGAASLGTRRWRTMET